jgi:sec-independent protein translocase protein TatA
MLPLPSELLIILGILVLIFGATKLPELARGTGQALRIFKTETRGLLDDESPETPRTTGRGEFESLQADLDRRQSEIDTERHRMGRPDGD